MKHNGFMTNYSEADAINVKDSGTKTKRKTASRSQTKEWWKLENGLGKTEPNTERLA